MLAYAASRPAPVQRRPYPNAMLAIIGIHVAALAVLMSAKMDMPPIIAHPPTDIFWVPAPKDPPPPTRPTHDTTPLQPTQQTYTHTDPVLPLPLPQNPDLGGGPGNNLGTLGGGDTVVIPEIRPFVQDPVKLGPRLATPPWELKPPYPMAKLASEEEAVLNLRLTI